MGHQIVRQPNGNFAVWSSVVDDFIMWDCTVEELVKGDALDYQRRSSEAEQKIRDICAKLEAGEKPYFQFTRTFEEMVEFSRLQHGETDTLRTVIELANTPRTCQCGTGTVPLGQTLCENCQWVDKTYPHLTQPENRQIDEFADYAEDDAQVDAIITDMTAKRGDRVDALPAEVKAGMRGACFGSIAAIRFSGSATAAQLKKISDYILALEHDRENRTDPLREAVTPFAAEVPANFGDNPGLSAISDARAEFRLTGLFNQHVTVEFPMAALVRLIRVARAVKEGEL